MPRIKALKPYVAVYETEYELIELPCGDSDAVGDHEGAYRKLISCVPDKWDLEDGKSAVDLALDVLNDQPAYLEPDCMPGIPSWFGGADHENDRAWRTGGWTEYSVHFYGFTADQRVRIGHAYATR